MKKPIALITLITLAGGGLAACGNLGGNRVDSKEVFKMQAVTGLQLVSGARSASFARFSAPRGLSESDTKKIQDVLPTVDLLMDNSGSGFSSKVETVNQEIEGKNYEFKETITFLNADLSKSSYTLLYNQGEERTEEEEGEIETVSYRSGLAFVTEDTSYPFYCVEETEVEGNESEKEQKFVIQTDIASSIMIKEEFEKEGNEVEQELHYVVKVDGRTTTDYKIEIENERHKDEIEIEIGSAEYEIERKNKKGEIYYTVSQSDRLEVVLATFRKEVDENGNVAYVVA